MPGDVAYSYEQRFEGTHWGTDIFAPAGTPVLAVEAGRAWADRDTAKGGNTVYLETPGGVRYYYAHLSIDFVDTHPIDVAAGAELGAVGTTGNARGRPPHLHFQMRMGSLRIDPFGDLLAADPHRRGVASMGATAVWVLLGLLLLAGRR